MTAWPTWFESSVWKTPIAPVTIGIATMPATSAVSSARRTSPPGLRGSAVSRTARNRNVGTTPSAAEATMSPQTTARRAR